MTGRSCIHFLGLCWPAHLSLLATRMFIIHIKGGSAVYKSQDPIRVTNHKDPISEETKKILSNTKVWRMEYDFYNFAKKIFDQELHCIFRLHSIFVILTVTRPFALSFCNTI